MLRIGYFEDDFKNNCVTCKITYPTGNMLFTVEIMKEVDTGLFIRLAAYKALKFYGGL